MLLSMAPVQTSFALQLPFPTGFAGRLGPFAVSCKALHIVTQAVAQLP